MRTATILVVALVAALLAAVPARAQGNGEIAGSFAWGHTSEGALVYEPAGFLFEGTGFLNEWLGITGEFGFGTGSGDVTFLAVPVADVTIRTTTFMAGPRFRFRNDSRVTPSVRVVAGGAHHAIDVEVLGIGVEDATTVFTMGFGGAVDVGLSDRAALRVQPDVLVFDMDDTMFRLSVGVAYAFGGGVP